ncbi:hypothetical protein ACHAP8_000129 [Fusarium lateritium]
MELPFVTLDVFTKTRYRGNPLAVVTIPADSNSRKPTQEQKQTIAREFNLSETVFIHEASPDAGSDVTRRVIDIFTTDAEIPFAGHPTIGAAVTLIPKGVDTVITKAGPIALTQTRPGYIQAAIPHNVRCHQKTLADLSAPAPAPGQISSDPAIRDCELRAPLFSIVNGMTFALIELPDLDHLGRVQLSGVSLPANDVLDDGWKKSLLCKYYYVVNSRREEDGVSIYSIRSRMMEAAMEDPATGSAASALSSYLSLQQTSTGDHDLRYEIDQGVEMGRESNIVVDVGMKGSEIATVKLSGAATPVMRGFVSV